VAYLKSELPENPDWGAPRIHGELLKLGIDIAQSSVSALPQTAVSHLAHLPGEPCPTAGLDRFLHRATIRFQVLYVFLVLAHDRRPILQFNVTAHANCTGQQLREAVPFA